jgi:hypothetical protein
MPHSSNTEVQIVRTKVSTCGKTIRLRSVVGIYGEKSGLRGIFQVYDMPNLEIFIAMPELYSFAVRQHKETPTLPLALTGRGEGASLLLTGYQVRVVLCG